MLTFWIIASLLTLLALAFILPPLLKTGKKIDDVERDQINVAIYQERLAELEKESLTAEQFAAGKGELDQTLLHDIEHENDTLDQPRARISSAIAVTVLVPVLAIAMYWHYGDWSLIEGEVSHGRAIATQGAPNAAAQQTANNAESLPESVARLAARLKQEPEDLEGWIMLARSYSMLEQPQQAAQAYTKAMALMPEQDPDILAEAAEALAAANEGRMGGQPEILIKAALDLDPNNQRALFFAGVAAMQKQAFNEAVQHWQTLLTLVPEDQTEIKQVLTQQIQRAQALADAGGVMPPAAATQSTTETTTTGTAAIQVTVTLDPALTDQVQPNHTVFIYARPPSGPPMPVAIARATVAQLPLTVTLDDNSAMMPNRRLSQFETVAVVARISTTGQASPQAGDWLSQVTEVQPATQPTVTLAIRHPYGEAPPPPSVRQELPAAASELSENSPPPVNADASSVQVQVTVSSALQDQMNPSDTVFIFAKAANGPPMPLAVVRKTAAELPLTVTLNDDMAMMPDLKLSSFAQVVVSARISTSGTAQPQSGDLQGISEPFAVQNTESVSVIIDQKLP